mmetsp:Transcript_51281/g.128663  ORF Transcript_51281/g.128663 Transcript_51281/m.128663 type:complete len:166 (+) Transcript_51281:61-558(+)|eukprot:CAMPEP_0177646384 /NCGR_PEP_ID=MMETSP0447-20121125/9746_1 /TAXON_ID=0 /ORGANISM="Stygamoeba regulata, Strain BSH-02190019" /LENGTH=165 /DNA_ID=CAMNT_0019148915 /DNA_START=45 /DNA_END=542 /DNA_ORIENTATION=+
MVAGIESTRLSDWAVPVLIAVIHFVGWTWVDILLWARIFEAHDLFAYSAEYHLGWWVSLITMVAGSVCALAPSGKRRVGLFLWTSFCLSCTSMEDMCYYMFDGRPLPAILPWLNINPFILCRPVTSRCLVASCSAWAVMWLAGALAGWRLTQPAATAGRSGTCTV